MKDELIHEIKTLFPDLLAAILETTERTQYDGFPWTVERLIEENPPLFKSLVEDYRDNIRPSMLNGEMVTSDSAVPQFCTLASTPKCIRELEI